VPIGKSSLLIVLLSLFALANISAAATYTAANVKGSYSVLINGYGGQASETAWIGLLRFDGVSAVSGYVTIADCCDEGGLYLATISSGSTYSVSPNGSGLMTLTFTGSNGTETGQIAFTLNSVTASVAQNLQLLLIDTSENDSHVRNGTANAMNLSGSATPAKLKGTYSILLSWWTTGTQQGLVGTLTFDGKSKATLTFTDQLAELGSTTGKGSGTYSVNADGSGSIGLTLSESISNSTTMQLDFVLNSIKGPVAKGLQLLDVTNPTSTSIDTGTAVLE
jgi:hypothetical protein